jgi:hypothetical protein
MLVVANLGLAAQAALAVAAVALGGLSPIYLLLLAVVLLPGAAARMRSYRFYAPLPSEGELE